LRKGAEETMNGALERGLDVGLEGQSRQIRPLGNK
jgi:ribosome modulation factor